MPLSSPFLTPGPGSIKNGSLLNNATRQGGGETGNGTADGDVASASRYRDNGELRYSIRSLHKYAPWLRKIFIVTNGQVPAWLDTTHPRLHVVTHAEIFPDPSVLPTFSSPAIETHLHRIPGLSRRFIYFNDDVMLGAPVWPDSFFTHVQGQKFYPAWEVPKCNTGCVEGWIGDGYCDSACNTSTCLWDGGDCLNNTKTRSGGGSSSSSSYEYSRYKGGKYEHYNKDSSGGGGEKEGEDSAQQQPYQIPSPIWDALCAPSCPNEWLGDMACDPVCNTAECGWDAEDCRNTTTTTTSRGHGMDSGERGGAGRLGGARGGAVSVLSHLSSSSYGGGGGPLRGSPHP